MLLDTSPWSLTWVDSHSVVSLCGNVIIKCYQCYQALSIHSYPLNNYCSCLQEHLSKGMYIWALYWLCEIFEKSCFGFLLTWRWKLQMVGKLFVHMVPSELRMRPQGHATHLRGTQISLPTLCWGSFPAQTSWCTKCFWLFCCVSDHSCSVVILACCHGFADRWEWHHTCTWDMDKWNFMTDTRGIHLQSFLLAEFQRSAVSNESMGTFNWRSS